MIKHKLLINIYQTDHIPTIGCMRTTVCWRPI